MEINLTAVVLAGIVVMALGALWYGPFFGKQWMRLSGIKESDIAKAKEKGMAKSYAASFVSSLVMAYVLALLLGLVGAGAVEPALRIATWLWLGFVATTMLGKVLWEGKPMKLYVLDSSYYLVSLLLMAAIIASM